MRSNKSFDTDKCVSALRALASCVPVNSDVKSRARAASTSAAET